MNSFENALFSGLEKNQYNTLWVEHRDKGRLELNFVIPNIELTTNKRLQPYFHKTDCKRINAWQDIKNIENRFTDPNLPSKKQDLTLSSNLAKDSKKALKLITESLNK